MATDTQNFPLQMATVFGRLSIGRKISLLLLVGATIFGSVFLMSWATRPEYGVLYSDLEPDDAGAILSKLKELKIPFQLHSNGRSIMIPREKVNEVRLDFASSGLPRGSTVGFELFDNTKLGMTEFSQNVNYQRAMQGELARTISGFVEVESCRIHIVMPPKSLFIENEKPATASVLLKLRPGKWLSQDQVDGIVHLVSSSIMGLKRGNVTVVDDHGKVLTGSRDETGIKKVGVYQLEYREKMERNLESRLTTILEKAVGDGKAIVRVSCPVNFKKHERTEELFYPENQVVRSEKLFRQSTDDETTEDGGIPSIVSKPAAVGAVAENIGGTIQKQDRTVNYEIGKVTSHTVEPFGKIEKISVAVLIDGIYQVETDKKGVETRNYSSRSPEEMKKLENIVKSAITFDTERGDQVSVVNLPFESTGVEDTGAASEESGWMDSVRQFGGPVLKYLLSFIVVIVVYLFIIRPIVQWVTATDVSDAQLLQQLPKTVGELEREFDNGANSLPAGNNTARMLTENSDKAVQLLRSWMSQQ